jgi:hypothetical protein
MAAYNVKALVSGYQPIDRHCIVIPVKFDGGLSMSVLRNKQLFTKKKVRRLPIFKTFQTPPFGIGHPIPHEKVPLFLGMILLLNEIVKLT